MLAQGSRVRAPLCSEGPARGAEPAGDATADERDIASQATAGHRFTGDQIPTAARRGPSSAPQSDTVVVIT
jgi:hypothetical protein